MLKNPQIDTDDIRHWLKLFEEALEQQLVGKFDQLWQQAQL